jgi:hypothetical protein
VIRDPVGLLEVVGDDHDRHLLTQLDDQILDHGGRARIERRAGLVEQQDLRLRGQRARDAQTLLLASGETQRGVIEVVGDLVEQTRSRQCRLDRRPQRLASRAAFGLIAQDVGDVVEHAHRERVRLLEDHRHATPQRGRLERRDVGPVERDLTGQRCRPGQLGQSVQRPQQRRLAATRRSDQRQHLALADRQRHRLDSEL